MSKHPIETAIANAAVQFTQEILSLIGSAAMGELAAMATAPRPARTHSPAQPQPESSKPAAKRSWPNCTVPGCTNRYFPASGKQYLCYEHFRQAGGKHPGTK